MTASASAGESSSGVSIARVRRELCADIDPMPGVSISVVPRRLCDGQSTTSLRSFSAGTPRSSTASAPLSRRIGSGLGSPPSSG